MLPVERDCHEVEHFDPGRSPALTLYLDTDPSRGGGRNLHAQLEDALRPVRTMLADEKEESARFESAVSIALAEVTALSPTPRAVGVFASPSQGFLRVIPLPEPVGARAHWGHELRIGPLVSALDEHERTVVALVDREHARVFRVFLGQIEEVATTVEKEPRATQAGRAQMKTNRVSRGHGIHMGYGERNLQRRQEWHVRRHLERTLAAMRPDGDRVLLGGGQEALVELLRLLPKRVRSRTQVMSGIAADASPPEVLARVLAAQARAEREEEEELLADLKERERARSVFGAEAVSEAVGEGRVHTLLYAAQPELEGSECKTCGALTPGPIEGACPKCEGVLAPLPDLVERLIYRTIHDGGRVEEVRGHVREELLAEQGVAALLRYVPAPTEVPPLRAGPRRRRRLRADKT